MDGALTWLSSPLWGSSPILYFQLDTKPCNISFFKCFFAFISLIGLVVNKMRLRMWRCLINCTTPYTLQVINPFNFCLLAPKLRTSHSKFNRLNCPAFFQSSPSCHPHIPMKVTPPKTLVIMFCHPIPSTRSSLWPVRFQNY